MTSESLKTLVGTVVIAVVVVATFLYGNAQRQNQLRDSQDAAAKVAQSSPSPSATPAQDSAGLAAASGTVHNTAPVSTPAASSIQGGGLGTASPAPAVTPSGTITAVAAATVRPPAPTSIPATGSSSLPLVGLSAITVSLLYVRFSRRQVMAAARARSGRTSVD